MLLTWKYAEQLPWGVIILFGGGLSLANAFVATGLAEWIGHTLQVVGTLPLIVIVVSITALIIFLTEFNEATPRPPRLFLPIVGAVCD